MKIRKENKAKLTPKPTSEPEKPRSMPAVVKVTAPPDVSVTAESTANQEISTAVATQAAQVE